MKKEIVTCDNCGREIENALSPFRVQGTAYDVCSDCRSGRVTLGEIPVEWPRWVPSRLVVEWMNARPTSGEGEAITRHVKTLAAHVKRGETNRMLEARILNLPTHSGDLSQLHTEVRRLQTVVEHQDYGTKE